jgi:hypothetical protein
MPIKDNWASDSLAANPIQTTTTFTNLTVNGLSMSAPGTNNTAQLTKTGIIGDVDVVEYLASMGFDYTPLIIASGDSHGYKSANGSSSENADGLANGEWTATWDSYGTVKGTSRCSADWDGYSLGNTISGTPASITNQSANVGCWCKMTSFTEKDDGPTHNDTSLWVFGYTHGSASVCANDCAAGCGYSVRSLSDMRSGLFGSVAQ